MTKLVQTIDWSQENIKNFWDFYSQFPHLYFTFQYGDKIVSEFKSYLRSDSVVLDYGCGTGFLMKDLINQQLVVYGTDTSSASIETVRKKYNGNKNFKGAYLTEELTANRQFNNFFDAIFLIEVIEHLPDDFLKSVFSDLRQLLKPDGLIFITTPNNENLEASFVYCPVSKTVFHRWQHVRSWSALSLSSFLKSENMSTLKVFATDFEKKKSAGMKLKEYAVDLLAKWGRKKGESGGPHLVCIGKPMSS